MKQIDGLPRQRWAVAGLALGLCCGCALSSSSGPSAVASGPVPEEAAGLVALVHPTERFVVIDFGGRLAPAVGATVAVYRAEAKVGAVEVSEPVRPRFVTADVVAGAPQVGDWIR